MKEATYEQLSSAELELIKGGSWILIQTPDGNYQYVWIEADEEESDLGTI
jgi:hypothetical protein